MVSPALSVERITRKLVNLFFAYFSPTTTNSMSSVGTVAVAEADFIANIYLYLSIAHTAPAHLAQDAPFVARRRHL